MLFRSLGLAAAGLLARGSGREDDPDRIRQRYGPLLVPVAWMQRARVETVVAVTSMEALVRLAERYDRAILHEESTGVHTYFVEDAGVVYRFEAQEGQPVGEGVGLPLERPVAET